MLTRVYPVKSKLEEMPLTLEMTLTMRQWRELREQLANKWPACDVAMAISEAVQGIEKALSAYQYKD